METSLMLKKSNAFITSKYKSTLQEGKIMAVALSRIEEEAQGNERDAKLVAKLYPGELKHLLGSPTNIYNTLKKVSKSIVGHTMLIEDGNGNFKSFAIVTNADYIDGEFSIVFNDAIKPHVFGLKTNYTKLELTVMTSVSSNSSYRIYELLKKEVYRCDPNVNGGKVDIEYNLNEFRFMIGLANIEEQAVKNAIARMGRNIDWDYLYENVVNEKMYSDVRNLQKKILNPAKEELADLSNIQFDYKLKCIRGNKYSHIVFTVSSNTPSKKNAQMIDKKKKILEQNEQMEYPEIQYQEFYDKYIGHNRLTRDDLDVLICKSVYNIELIEQAILAADKQNYIGNYMGWLIKYIERGGYNVVPVSNGNAEQGERVEQVKAVYESTDKNEIAEMSWTKSKSQPEFDEFEQYIKLQGLTISQLELIYSTPERISMYTDWRIEKMKEGM